MWRTKVTAKDNNVPITIEVGDDTSIRMVRHGEGLFSIVIDAPIKKTIVRRNGAVCAPGTLDIE